MVYATAKNGTIEQLAKAFRALSISERTKLAELLPQNWFEKTNGLTETQKQALDLLQKKKTKEELFFIFGKK